MYLPNEMMANRHQFKRLFENLESVQASPAKRARRSTRAHPSAAPLFSTDDPDKLAVDFAHAINDSNNQEDGDDTSGDDTTSNNTSRSSSQEPGPSGTRNNKKTNNKNKRVAAKNSQTKSGRRNQIHNNDSSDVSDSESDDIDVETVSPAPRKTRGAGGDKNSTSPTKAGSQMTSPSLGRARNGTSPTTGSASKRQKNLSLTATTTTGPARSPHKLRSPIPSSPHQKRKQQQRLHRGREQSSSPSESPPVTKRSDEKNSNSHGRNNKIINGDASPSDTSEPDESNEPTNVVGTDNRRSRSGMIQNSRTTKGGKLALSPSKSPSSCSKAKTLKSTDQQQTSSRTDVTNRHKTSDAKPKNSSSSKTSSTDLLPPVKNSKTTTTTTTLLLSGGNRLQDAENTGTVVAPRQSRRSGIGNLAHNNLGCRQNAAASSSASPVKSQHNSVHRTDGGCNNDDEHCNGPPTVSTVSTQQQRRQLRRSHQQPDENDATVVADTDVSVTPAGANVEKRLTRGRQLQHRDHDNHQRDDSESRERSCTPMSQYEGKAKSTHPLKPHSSKNVKSRKPRESSEEHKTAELIRTDYVTAMKIGDADSFDPNYAIMIMDSWRNEWNAGVQVPIVGRDQLPRPMCVDAEPPQIARARRDWKMPRKYVSFKKCLKKLNSSNVGTADAAANNVNATSTQLATVRAPSLEDSSRKTPKSGDDSPAIPSAAADAVGSSLLSSQPYNSYDSDDLDIRWIKACYNDVAQAPCTSSTDDTSAAAVRNTKLIGTTAGWPSGTVCELNARRRAFESCMELMELTCNAALDSFGYSSGIEYDENTVCDVCLTPDSEENNEMVFCDVCEVCVHQACYGIPFVPAGSWLCRVCAMGVIKPPCILCPNTGGAMKSTRSGQRWAHVSCALWIPEISFGDPDLVEPITNIAGVAEERWMLRCVLCKQKEGACIQCSHRSCPVAYHVTCAQRQRLDVQVCLSEDTDEVKMVSYCSKHGARRSPRKSNNHNIQDAEDKEIVRRRRIMDAQDFFFEHVDPTYVANRLALSEDIVYPIFEYWKLKRKANFNQPVLRLRENVEKTMEKMQENALVRRVRMLISLRQNLEKARNLCYMVVRRERLKKQLVTNIGSTFHCELDGLDKVPNLKLLTKRDLSMFQKFVNTGVSPYEQLIMAMRGGDGGDNPDCVSDDEFVSPTSPELLHASTTSTPVDTVFAKPYPVESTGDDEISREPASEAGHPEPSPSVPNTGPVDNALPTRKPQRDLKVDLSGSSQSLPTTASSHGSPPTTAPLSEPGSNHSDSVIIVTPTGKVIRKPATAAGSPIASAFNFNKARNGFVVAAGKDDDTVNVVDYRDIVSSEKELPPAVKKLKTDAYAEHSLPSYVLSLSPKRQITIRKNNNAGHDDAVDKKLFSQKIVGPNTNQTDEKELQAETGSVGDCEHNKNSNDSNNNKDSTIEDVDDSEVDGSLPTLNSSDSSSASGQIQYDMTVSDDGYAAQVNGGDNNGRRLDYQHLNNNNMDGASEDNTAIGSSERAVVNAIKKRRLRIAAPRSGGGGGRGSGRRGGGARGSGGRQVSGPAGGTGRSVGRPRIHHPAQPYQQFSARASLSESDAYQMGLDDFSETAQQFSAASMMEVPCSSGTVTLGGVSRIRRNTASTSSAAANNSDLLIRADGPPQYQHFIYRPPKTKRNTALGVTGRPLMFAPPAAIVIEAKEDASGGLSETATHYYDPRVHSFIVRSPQRSIPLPVSATAQQAHKQSPSSSISSIANRNNTHMGASPLSYCRPVLPRSPARPSHLMGHQLDYPRSRQQQLTARGSAGGGAAFRQPQYYARQHSFPMGAGGSPTPTFNRGAASFCEMEDTMSSFATAAGTGVSPMEQRGNNVSHSQTTPSTPESDHGYCLSPDSSRHQNRRNNSGTSTSVVAGVKRALPPGSSSGSGGPTMMTSTGTQAAIGGMTQRHNASVQLMTHYNPSRPPHIVAGTLVDVLARQQQERQWRQQQQQRLQSQRDDVAGGGDAPGNARMLDFFPRSTNGAGRVMAGQSKPSTASGGKKTTTTAGMWAPVTSPVAAGRVSGNWSSRDVCGGQPQKQWLTRGEDEDRDDVTAASTSRSYHQQSIKVYGAPVSKNGKHPQPPPGNDTGVGWSSYRNETTNGNGYPESDLMPDAAASQDLLARSRRRPAPAFFGRNSGGSSTDFGSGGAGVVLSPPSGREMVRRDERLTSRSPPAPEELFANYGASTSADLSGCSSGSGRGTGAGLDFTTDFFNGGGVSVGSSPTAGKEHLQRGSGTALSTSQHQLYGLDGSSTDDDFLHSSRNNFSARTKPPTTISVLLNNSSNSPITSNNTTPTSQRHSSPMSDNTRAMRLATSRKIAASSEKPQFTSPTASRPQNSQQHRRHDNNLDSTASMSTSGSDTLCAGYAGKSDGKTSLGLPPSAIGTPAHEVPGGPDEPGYWPIFGRPGSIVANGVVVKQQAVTTHPAENLRMNVDMKTGVGQAKLNGSSQPDDDDDDAESGEFEVTPQSDVITLNPDNDRKVVNNGGDVEFIGETLDTIHTPGLGNIRRRSKKVS